jgi:peptidoglycan/LPS O-acetylase OafA/YrhL
MKEGRFRELDVLRGLAALGVVLFHYLTRYDQMYTPRADVPFGFPIGASGVELFFVISGFVIFMTLGRCASASDFLISRFSRLYPAYWAAALLTWSVGTVWPLPKQGYTINQLVINLTMAQGFINVEPIDGVYWSLNVELCFYIVMLLLFTCGFLNYTVRVCSVWLAVAALNRWLSDYGIDIPWKIQQVLVLRYAELFVAGIVFYKIYAERLNITHSVLLIGCISLHTIAHGRQGLVSILAIFGLVGIAVSGRAQLLCARPLIWLGTISYTLYLTHQMIGFALIREFDSYNVPSSLAVPVTISVMLGGACAITYLIEQPSMRYIRARYRSRIVAVSNAVQPAIATGGKTDVS